MSTSKSVKKAVWGLSRWRVTGMAVDAVCVDEKEREGLQR